MTQALLVNGIWMLCYLVYIWTNTLLWGRISKSESWTERQCFLKQLLSAASWYSHYQFKLLLSKLRESSIYHWVNTQGERGGNTERKRLRTSLERERTCVYFSTRGSEKNPTAQHSKNPNPCFCFWEYMGKCVCVCVCSVQPQPLKMHNCLSFSWNKPTWSQSTTTDCSPQSLRLRVTQNSSSPGVSKLLDMNPTFLVISTP